MRYLSTRGKGELVSAGSALLDGAAKDGGLYVPETLPDLSFLLEGKLTYQELAAAVFEAFFPDFDRNDLIKASESAYQKQFDHEDVTPLVPVGDCFILELFHGPTCAFKDLALQALPRFLGMARNRLDPHSHYLVLTATSGDTGSAAMRGFLNVPGFFVLVYYPEHGVSAVQKAQMTRMPGDNVKAVGILGNFDDAQAGIKAAFQMSPDELPDGPKLTSANSINIGRLIPQIVYYISACRQLKESGALKPGQAVDFVVPSGNFGDIFAGYLAKRAGMPVGKLVCASNRNSVLADFIKTGVYDSRRELYKTLSPSMDILVSSNLERLLYYAAEEDADKVSGMMRQLKEEGWYKADEGVMERIRADFDAAFADDELALEAIREVFLEHHYLMDPHTATAFLAKDVLKGRDNPCVVLSTASPFKFPEAIFKALNHDLPEDGYEQLKALSDLTGVPVPPALKSVMALPEKKTKAIKKDEVVADVKRRAQKWS